MAILTGDGLDRRGQFVHNLMIHVGLVAHEDATTAVPLDTIFFKKCEPVFFLIVLEKFTVRFPRVFQIPQDFAACIASDR